jgi:ABC-type iron transport system FetAB ATPase subunit
MSFINLLQMKKVNITKSLGDNNKLKCELESKFKLKVKSKEVITKISYLKKQEMKVIVDIVNKGLQYSYPDKSLIFDMKFEEKNNKIVPEFYLNDIELKAPFIGDGGGIISMIGLLLYITYLKLKNIKITLLDEVESMVDIEASKRLFEFIDYFAKENNMDMLLITHKELDYDYKEITDKINMLKLS